MKVKVIPIDAPFLRTLAEYLCGKFSELLPDFSRILIVFPSQRNKYYFRRYLLEASKKRGIILPAMHTIDELINHYYQSFEGKKGLTLNKLERNFILKYTIDKLRIEFWRELPFLNFLSIGDRLQSFFDELARERVGLNQIEEVVLNGHYPERYVKNELPIIKEIFKNYRRHIKEQGFFDEVDRCNLVYEKFSARIFKAYKYICIAGLVAATTLENRLLKEILKNLNSELILHSESEKLKVGGYVENPFYQHHKILKNLETEEVIEISSFSPPKTPKPNIHLIRTESIAEQSAGISQILSRIKNYYEPHRIAIIITDESTIYSITEAVKGSGLEYNISIGLPFSHSLLYSFLDQLISAITKNLHFQEFFAFLKHPLVKNAVIGDNPLRPLIYRLIEKMVKDKANYFTSEEYTNNNFEPLIKFITECIDKVSKRMEIREYINNIIELLNRILIYNQEFLASGALGINEFFERLNSLSKLRIPGAVIEPGMDTLKFILRVLRDEKFHIRGEPMRGIQVIGLLEARNLDFDCIILPSMNEGVFPARSEKDLFVNQAVRKKLGLPYDKERENLYYYYFEEMRAGKKEVFIIYVEEKKKDIPSRFVNFLFDEGKEIHRSRLEIKGVNIRTIKRMVKKDFTVLRTLERLLAKKISPTDLKNYRECPYRFYLSYVLNIEEPEEIVEEAGPREWGIILHYALKEFYKYDFPSGFTEAQLTRAQKKLAYRLDYALKKHIARKPASTTVFNLKDQKSILNEFLRNEIKRFKEGYRIDRAVLEGKLDYQIIYNGHSIQFKGFLDRVDQYQGRFYIIDYKRSAPDKKDYKIGKDFKEFQLPLYAIILSRDRPEMVCGMAYYQLSKEIKMYSIVSDRNEIVPYLNDFKEKILKPTIDEIFNPEKDFYQTDNPDNCKYCSYKSLCGVEYGRD